MANPPTTLRVAVEFGSDSVENMKKAVQRFEAAQKELLDATRAVENAMYELKNSITISKSGEEPIQP